MSTFNTAFRSKLWCKLKYITIDKCLLLLLIKIHENTKLKVRCSYQGHVTKEIPVRRGVREGCALASVLFNYYTDSLFLHLSNFTFHLPKLAHRYINLLLYGDDSVILSLTFIGLKITLGSPTHCCIEEESIINYFKTKILTFS